MIQMYNGLAGLTAAVRDLFPPQVSVAAVDPRVPQPSILPEEAPAMANAVESRRREFAAGRAAARQAMAPLGRGESAIPMGEDRAPIWPEGVVGSISHTVSHCAAVAASAKHVQSLGLDVEADTPLAQHLWEEICTPAETAWLAEQPQPLRGWLAKLIFSAKECAFKCQYPLTGKFVDFQDASVELDQENSTFEIVFGADILSAQGNRLRGKYRRDTEFLIVGMTLPQPVARTSGCAA